jgi:hypothetical protein
VSEYDDDGDRFDDERDDAPGAFERVIPCEDCGRDYTATVTAHDASYDSPGWYEPEPGHEACPSCLENRAAADAEARHESRYYGPV